MRAAPFQNRIVPCPAGTIALQRPQISGVVFVRLIAKACAVFAPNTPRYGYGPGAYVLGRSLQHPRERHAPRVLYRRGTAYRHFLGYAYRKPSAAHRLGVIGRYGV